MVLPDEPTVGEFFALSRQILREHGYGHLVSALDNIKFILTKLEFLERLYSVKHIDFSQLGWIQKYYRS